MHLASWRALPTFAATGITATRLWISSSDAHPPGPHPEQPAEIAAEVRTSDETRSRSMGLPPALGVSEHTAPLPASLDRTIAGQHDARDCGIEARTGPTRDGVSHPHRRSRGLRGSHPTAARGG